MDVRAHPRGGEEFFEDTQEKGVLFTRANVAEIIPTPEGLLIRGEDTLFGETFEREFDLAVLSIGMSPPADNKLISSLLKISLDKDKFFLEAHVKLRPYDTALKGIFIAGTCSGPKDMEESINHGRASAVKLFGFLNLGYAFVEPFIAWWMRRGAAAAGCASRPVWQRRSSMMRRRGSSAWRRRPAWAAVSATAPAHRRR